MKALKVFRFFTVLLAFGLSGCEYPTDSDGSFSRIKNGSMKVGVIPSEPWREKESRLIEEFAASIDAKIDWTEGTESELSQSLEKRKLDVVIGGLQQKNPLFEKAGISYAYEDKHVFAVASGENRLLIELEKFLRQKMRRKTQENG